LENSYSARVSAPITRNRVVAPRFNRRAWGSRTVPLASLRTGAASDTKSDPLGVVLREYPGCVIAGMICFFAFFGIALGLGAWLPN
jgi:hypothetical protein